MPTRSKTPITASRLAAVTSDMPWSIAAGIRCVPMSPFVVAPQTKKLAVRSQNVDVREASARPPIAARKGFCCTIGGSSTTAPNGRSPISAGLSRRKSATSGSVKARATIETVSAGGAPALRR